VQLTIKTEDKKTITIDAREVEGKPGISGSDIRRNAITYLEEFDTANTRFIAPDRRMRKSESHSQLKFRSRGRRHHAAPGFAGLLCPQDRYGIIMHRTERPDDHERFKELCALAQANSLGMVDQLELKEHLKICDSCRKIYDQYAAIGSEGMAFLADAMP